MFFLNLDLKLRKESGCKHLELDLIITKRLLEKFFHEELELVHRDKTQRISLWVITS